MAKDIQIKFRDEDGDWEELFPATKSRIVTTENGQYLEDVLTSVDSEIERLGLKDENLTTQLAQMPKDYPILNILDFGADNSGVEDISPILDHIMTEYNGAELQFPAGTYFMDVNYEGELGNSYDKHFIFKGVKGSSIIKINSYLGTKPVLIKARIHYRDLTLDGMCKEPDVVINKVLIPYVTGVESIQGCTLKNFNGNLEIPSQRRIIIKDNVFDYFVDHAIYTRNVLDTVSEEQELIIENNTFLGTGNFNDYVGELASNPRDAIKIVGKLNRVSIKNNIFKGNHGDILFQHNEGNQLMAENLEIVGNTFYSGYHSIMLYGASGETSIEFDSEVFIEGNTFRDGSTLNIEGYNYQSTTSIYLRKGFTSKVLNIKNNDFVGIGNNFFILADNPSNYEKTQGVVSGNTISNGRLSIMNYSLTITDNTFSDCVSLIARDVNTAELFRNTFIRCNEIFTQPIGFNSNLLVSQNTFIKCDNIVKSALYGGGYMWIGNTFRDSEYIFDTSTAENPNSFSGNFIFSKNTVINSTLTQALPESIEQKINSWTNDFLVEGVWKTSV